MSYKDTVFYKKNKAYFVNSKAQNLSSDGGILIAEHVEKQCRIIKNTSDTFVDNRNQNYVTHSYYDMLKQRVYGILLGYEDANDVEKLKQDALIKEILDEKLASQPTISRFENSFDKTQVFRTLYAWIDKYIISLKGRKKVTIDIDGTDAQTYGHQQLSLFNGFYGHFMYNELFFHDGETGQIITPVLRPGNAHSNWWYVSILKRIIKRIYAQYPDIEIFIRADSGFSTPVFYKFAREYKLKYTIAIASNAVLKRKTQLLSNCVSYSYVKKGMKKQVFTNGFDYQAESWEQSEKCYAKVESTGKGLNIRYFISNFEDKSAREIYFDFYVKRGDTSENRIKEVKNMCFSDRLSDSNFHANFLRLIISSLAYEIMLLIKEKIKKVTKDEQPKKWLVNNIRLFLFKVAAVVRITKRRIIISISSTAIYKDLFLSIIRT
ncbi:MAG: IS1380 family transposase [Bacteroidota bacterium]|nr:IS1380 family transposase [Bacteroidota bacterium]